MAQEMFPDPHEDANPNGVVSEPKLAHLDNRSSLDGRRVIYPSDIAEKEIKAPSLVECDCVKPTYSSFVRHTSTEMEKSRPPLIVQSIEPEWAFGFDSEGELGGFLIEQKLDESSLPDLESWTVDANCQVKAHTGDRLAAWLHVTNQCNLRCDYCYIDKTPERMRADVAHAAIDTVMRTATDGDFVGVLLKFAGGEATLRASLVLKLDLYGRQRAQALGLEYEAVVLSNGVRIEKEFASECRERGIKLAISLDGLGMAHDRQRRFLHGGGSSHHVVQTIEALVDDGHTPFITITVSDKTTDSLPETVDFVLARGLPFNINFVRDSAHSTDFAALRLQEERTIAALHAACDVIETRLPRHSLLSVLVDRSDFAQPHTKACGAGDSYMAIDHHGRIAKCHMELQQPVTDIHAVDPLAAIRQDPRGVRNMGVEEKEGCRDCRWRYWCAGGCPQLTYKVTGRYDLRSPYCKIYKSIYPRLLRLEGLRLLKLAREAGLIA